jgi:hypothetical protein
MSHIVHPLRIDGGMKPDEWTLCSRDITCSQESSTIFDDEKFTRMIMKALKMSCANSEESI